MWASQLAPAVACDQVSALNSFTMGNFTKFFLKFESNFWAGRGAQWLAAPEMAVGGSPRWPIEFHDLGAMVPGSNTLFTYVVGENAAEWESLSGKEATARLMARLRLQFGAALPEPIAVHRTAHGSDVLTHGAYSAVKVGVTMDQMRAMIEPLKLANGQPIQVEESKFPSVASLVIINE